MFSVDMDTIKYKNDNLNEVGNEIQDIDVCIGYDGDTTSGMVIAQMDMVSGWKLVDQSLKDIDCKYSNLGYFRV